MKKRSLYLVGASILAGALMFTSCVNDNGMTTKEYKQSQANDFDFSTVNSVKMTVKYQTGGMNNETCFEVYDEMPVNDLGYKYEKKEGIKPLFAGYTDEDGNFSGTVKMPSYCSKVYLYSPNMFSARVLEGTIENGVLNIVEPAYDSNKVSATPAYGTKQSTSRYDSYMVSGNNVSYSDGPWKTWLGTYDMFGYVAYGYYGGDSKLQIGTREASDLYNAFSSVIYSKQDCPKEYRCFTDLNVKETAEVAVTYLGGNTCWNSSLGYYYYKDGEAPSSLKEANVIMLFPNTQDGRWEKDQRRATYTQGVTRGTTVQLKYYPNIKSGSKEGETTVFPAGYKIGFVLATNAHQNRIDGYSYTKNDQKYRAATTKGLSVQVNGTPYADDTRTAAFKYGDRVMISFEDHNDDSNFSDVVIALSANPIKAIDNVPDVDPTTKKSTVNAVGGVYAFEDLWPYAGDYDMNDVVARYETSKTFGPGKNGVNGNTYYEESAIFTLFQNDASIVNSFAVKIANDNGVKAKLYRKSIVANEFEEVADFTYKPADNVYVLSEDVKDDIQAGYNMYKLVVDYGTNGVIKEPLEVKPFIFRKQANGKLLEVHIPGEAPTSEFDTSLFTTADDCSNPAAGKYFVRRGNYPFAFFLAGETETVLSKILDPSNEMKKIDSVFPNYTKWVESNGTQYMDWYKK